MPPKNDLETNRKICLKQQTELRTLLGDPARHEDAMQLFLRQHAMLHSARVSPEEHWSYEDALLDDMVRRNHNEEQIRRVPPGCEHSVAWIIWHIARCEDITMNLLVAGSPQILHQGSWLEKLNITNPATGNAMAAADVVRFSSMVNIAALRGYRLAVGRATRIIASQLSAADIKRKVDPSRLQRVIAEEAVVNAAMDIVKYWGSRTFGGLLLMPATRHNLTHLNEAWDLKRKNQDS